MKRLLAILATELLLSVAGYAQVAINSDGSSPDASAILDVKSSDKGLLVPRMTTVQRDAISSPATGLLVYDTDNNQYYTNRGTPASPNWVMLASQWFTQPNGSDITYTGGFVGIGTNTPHHSLQVAGRISAAYGSSYNPTYVFDAGLENTGLSSPAGYTIAFITNGSESARINWNGDFGLGTQNPAYRLDVNGDINSNGNVRLNGVPIVSSPWTREGTDISYNVGKVGIGTLYPDPSSALDVSSTNKGFLPPRMTMAQRNAITNPANGLQIICSDCSPSNVFQCYVSGSWHDLVFNRAPQAQNVTQSGLKAIGQAVTGSYTYFDPDGDQEASSLYKWYRADNAAGLNEVLIAGATGNAYVPVDGDTGKFIRFSVTATALTGESPGIETISVEYLGPFSTWDCSLPFTDIRDGKSYNTVLIGSQCWMKENLNVGVFSLSQSDNGIIEKKCYLNNESNCDTFGGLYTWLELMNYPAIMNTPDNIHGICPAGWHVPLDDEWSTMEVLLDPSVNITGDGFCGLTIGGKLKEAGTIHWTSPNQGATNLSGFTALPGGLCHFGTYGTFDGLGVYGNFWTAYCGLSPYGRTLAGFNAKVIRMTANSGDYLSVRCLKD